MRLFCFSLSNAERVTEQEQVEGGRERKGRHKEAEEHHNFKPKLNSRSVRILRLSMQGKQTFETLSPVPWVAFGRTNFHVCDPTVKPTSGASNIPRYVFLLFLFPRPSKIPECVTNSIVVSVLQSNFLLVGYMGIC